MTIDLHEESVLVGAVTVLFETVCVRRGTPQGAKNRPIGLDS